VNFGFVNEHEGNQENGRSGDRAITYATKLPIRNCPSETSQLGKVQPGFELAPSRSKLSPDHRLW
jgi:hypothetical protein